MDQPIRVFIVDDYRVLTEAIASLLDVQEGITLAGLTVDPEEVLIKARSLPIDVMLVAVNLKSVNAALLIQEVKQDLDVKVVVFGLEHEGEGTLELIEAGASGYVLKEASFEQLLHTIKSVYHEQTPCSPQLAASVFARITELSREQSYQETLQQVTLTPREQDILSLITAGLGNKEIAHQLCISISTVKNHVHNIFEKLHVHYRREAIGCTFQSRGLKDLVHTSYPVRRASSMATLGGFGTRKN